MKSAKSLIGLVAAMSLLVAQSTLAVPVFQVYIDGATTDAMEPDEDMWVITDNAFDLIVSGAYGPWTKSLTEITLLISVPEGETGTISITGSDGSALLTERTEAADGYFNPNVDVVLDLLENETGYDGYSDKDFLPDDVKLNNHYPSKEDISNFLLYDIGSFGKSSNAVSNYSTDEPIAYNVADGEEKIYSILISGFSTAHFDVYGYVQTGKGRSCRSTWTTNPGSHDATYMASEMVPEPATILLLGLGSTVMISPRRRSRKRRRS